MGDRALWLVNLSFMFLFGYDADLIDLRGSEVCCKFSLSFICAGTTYLSWPKDTRFLP